jgi:hypothetical protein
LADAIAEDLRQTPAPDFRTRLLIRDAAAALRDYWGSQRFNAWLDRTSVGDRIRAILAEDLGPPGFPLIQRSLVTANTPLQLQQIFALLGQHVHQRTEVSIAGSIATLVEGLTVRPTADIDVVDEVPAEVRQQRKVLEKIEADYKLTLDHVQSHYLPRNWQDRRHYFGDFGKLRVYLVDVYDVFVSKLSSKQEKHLDDLRVLALKLDRETARERLLTDGRSFLDDPHLRPQIEANWQFLFQMPLFPAADAGPGRAPGG